MDKIYIIDAVNYLFRSYYAIRSMTNAKGESVNALYGFIRSVQKVIKTFQPTHLVCVFDGPDNKKSRKALFADYKMHRKGAPEDLFPQFDWAGTFCELTGISVLCVDGVEADDTMASIALWAKKQGAKAYLCSSDKDLAQLVDEDIFVLHPHKDHQLVNADNVKQLYNVRPDQMLDYLAIMGDASDNIPGLEGFGPKTAAALLEEFGTLDNILAHPEKVKGEKKQEILRTQKERALLSRDLARLDTAVEIPKEVFFYKIKEGDPKNLRTFYHEMHFSSLLREMGEAPSSEGKKKVRNTDKHEYHLIEDAAALDKLLKRLAQAKEVGVDVETTSEKPMLAELVGIGFCLEPGEAWYVPWQGQKELLHFFATAQCGFFGHNLKYDLHVLHNHGMPLHKIGFDTILASYLLQPQNRRHNLDDLALEKFRRVKIPLESLIGKGKSQITMREVPVEKVKEYCCEDIDYTARLKEFFEEELETRKLEKVFHEIELPLLPILAKMEQEGIYLDAEKLADIGAEQLRALQKLETKIFAEVGEEFNLNSPKQLSEVLFQKLGMKKPSRAKTEYATGAEVLEELAEEYPIAGLILEYRTLEKLRTTYIEALPTSIHPKTGRIHCTFNQSVAATGRLSCQDPNLQNIPVRAPEGIAIRSCFRPQKKGWSFVGADYSQIELRLLAHFSEDEELLRAFNEGEDVHAYTASLVFNLPITMVTPEMRNQAKTVNFGILYGQGPFGLAKQLGISMQEAASFIKTYFERYPKVSRYLEACKEEARRTGLATTLTGRQRPIPEIGNQNPQIRAAAERLAINTPLQGTAADLIKQAMIAIDREMAAKGWKGKMILQIHDELIFEVPDEEALLISKFVKKAMENVFPLRVPIEVHIAIGKNWAEC